MANIALPDASIPLSIQSYQMPDVLATYGKAMNIKSMQMDFDAKLQDQHDVSTMTDVLKNLDPSDPNYDDKATKALISAGVSPQKVASFRSQQLDAQTKQAKLDEAKINVQNGVQKFLSTKNADEIAQLDYANNAAYEASNDAVQTYDNIIKKGGANAQSTASAAAEQVFKSHLGLLASNENLPEDSRKTAAEYLKKPFNIDEARQLQAKSTDYKEALKNAAEAQKTKESAAREARDYALAQRALQPPAEKTKIIQEQGDDGKPHDILVDTQTGEKIRDIGISSKGTGGAGGRAQIYTNRIVNSANEASESLANLSKLNVDASTGFFSGSKHAGIFDASVDALGQKLTTQAQQSYKVVAAGLSRSLGTLETSGLSVPEGVRQQLDKALELTPGDTYFTRTQKLAEARQILDKSVESALATPGLGEDQKKILTNVQEKVHKAIPYTESQLIDYENDVIDQGKSTSIGTYLKREGDKESGKNPASDDPLGLLGK